MFLPQKMCKVDILILKKYADIVSKEVVKFGNFEIIEYSQERLKNYPLIKYKREDYLLKLSDFERKINYLISVYENILSQSFLMNKVNLDLYKDKEFFSELEIEKKIKDLEQELNQYNKEIEDLKRRKADIEIKISKINYFSNIDIDWNKLKDIKNFYIGFGIIPYTSYQGFISGFSSLPSVFHNIGAIGNDILVFFSVPRQYKDKAESILKSVYFRDYGIPYDVGSDLKSKLIRYAFELSSVHDEELWYDEKIIKMALNNYPLLMHLKKSIKYYNSLAKLNEEMIFTDKICIFSGWVPSKNIKKLEEIINSITEKRCVIITKDNVKEFQKEGLTPPTLLNNNSFFKPFEMLVSTFGTPGYREIDPTPFAALSYIIMYGAMFGDVGHGFVISLLGLLIMFLKKLKSFYNFGKIMFYVGISSMVFGFLYGEIFGLGEFIKTIWLKPAENIMLVLQLAIYFGIGIISIGLIINIINCFLEKDFGKMLFSSNGIAGLSLYWSVIYIVISIFYKKPIPGWLYIISIISVVFIILEKRLNFLIFKHGHKEPIAMGFFDIIEAGLSLMSNTISFMRVGAFAMNHGALMGVVFIIANMNSNPIVRWIVILIGNIIVIGFEGFVVGIQALRLEYYEFFTKFFRANGRPFGAIGVNKN